MKILKFRTKNVLIRYFWIGIWKPYCRVWNQCLQLLRKNENFYIWNQKCLIWVFLERTFKKLLSYLTPTPLNLIYWKVLWKNEDLICIVFWLKFEKDEFKIKILKFFWKQNLEQYWKSLNLGPKMSYFRALWWKLKILLSCLNLGPRISLTAKFCAKMKFIDWGPKMLYLCVLV